MLLEGFQRKRITQENLFCLVYRTHPSTQFLGRLEEEILPRDGIIVDVVVDGSFLLISTEKRLECRRQAVRSQMMIDGEDDDDTLIEYNGPLRIGRRVYFFGWRKRNSLALYYKNDN